MAILSATPLRFEPNGGQFASPAGFVMRGRGVNGLLSGAGIELVVNGPVAGSGEVPDDGLRGSIKPAPERVALRLVGADAGAAGRGEAPLSSRSSYLLGDDTSKWVRDVPNFARVRFVSVYPGVDAVYRSNEQGRLQYDLAVEPGASADDVRLAVDGAHRVSIATDGTLVIETPAGRTIRQRVPLLYQESDGERREWHGAYALAADNEVRLDLGTWDRTQALVVDPMVEVVGTWDGARKGRYDEARTSAVAIHKGGELVMIASSVKTLLPRIDDPTDLSPDETNVIGEEVGNADILLTRLELNPVDDDTGEQEPREPVVTYTYIGGEYDDYVTDVAYGRDGRVYVGGYTSSADFPVTHGIYHDPDDLVGQHHGYLDMFDGFVLVLQPSRPISSETPNPVADRLVYGAYLGGSRGDQVQALAVNNAGEVFLAGQTRSEDMQVYPQTGRAGLSVVQAGKAGGPDDWDGMVWGLNPDAADFPVIFGTYLGGSEFDDLTAIVYDERGRRIGAGDTASLQYGAIAVVGRTRSQDYPTGLFAAGPADLHGIDSVITVLNRYGSVLAHKRLPNTQARAMAIDFRGRLLVAGSTDTDRMRPVEDNNIIRYSAHSDELSPRATYRAAASYLRNKARDRVANGEYADRTKQNDAFPAQSGPQTSDPVPGGGNDAFVTRLDDAWEDWEFFTYLGANGHDHAIEIAADLVGNTHVLGFLGQAETNGEQTSPGYSYVVLDRDGNPSIVETLSKDEERDETDPTLQINPHMAVNVFGAAYIAGVWSVSTDSRQFERKVVRMWSNDDAGGSLTISNSLSREMTVSYTAAGQECEDRAALGIPCNEETIRVAALTGVIPPYGVTSPDYAVTVVDDVFTYQPVVSDADSIQALSYSIQPLPLPENASFDYNTGTLEFETDDDNWGSYLFQVTVSDGRTFARHVFNLKVFEKAGPEPTPSAFFESRRETLFRNVGPNMIRWNDKGEPILTLTQTYNDTPGEIVPVFDKINGYDRWGRRELALTKEMYVDIEDLTYVVVPLAGGYRCLFVPTAWSYGYPSYDSNERLTPLKFHALYFRILDYPLRVLYGADDGGEGISHARLRSPDSALSILWLSAPSKAQDGIGINTYKPCW